MNILVILGGLAIAILLWGALTYNRLVSLRVKAEKSWRDIDTQLKRRWDQQLELDLRLPLHLENRLMQKKDSREP